MIKKCGVARHGNKPKINTQTQLDFAHHKRDRIMTSKTEPMLTRRPAGQPDQPERFLYHFFDGKRGEGAPSNLTGDVTDLWGNATGLHGDVTGLRGNVDGLSGDVSSLSGDVTRLRGDVGGLRGDASGLWGDATGLRGNLDDIPLSERPADISEYVK